MSNWKVEVGTCNCKPWKLQALPIDFTPTFDPGLCPNCFWKGKSNERTIIDRLNTLENEQKELLLRNFYGAHLERRNAPTTRYKMAKFGLGRRYTNTETTSKTGINTPVPEQYKYVPTLSLYRFCWGNNPDPEEIRRLLYDDVPSAKHSLMRNVKQGWENIQIRPILVCETRPSRKNSAWENTINAASNWPVNSTDVLVRVYSDMILFMVAMAKRRKKKQSQKDGNDPQLF